MRLARLVLPALFVTVTAFAGAQTVDGKPEVKRQILDRLDRILARNAYVPGLDFSRWKEWSKENQAAFDKANTDLEFARAVNGALARFKASHIVLSTPRTAEQRRTGSLVGIGITGQVVEEGLLVVRTVKNAPAERSGLEAGDIITMVDGKKAEGTRGIPGAEGTTVRLTVKKRDGTVKEVTILRAKFSTRVPEELEWIDAQTARIVIPTFDMAYDGDNVDRIMAKAKTARTIVLDLRDNGGGAVFNLQHLMGYFVGKDTSLGTFVGRRMVDEYRKATEDATLDPAKVAAWSKEKLLPFKNDEVYGGKLVVLVNENSGSASEIAAAALKEQKNATIIGTKSAGAVLVSVIAPATNGFTIQYPLSDYITPKGRRLEGNGVLPDIEVKEPALRLPKDPDPVLERTKSYLSAVAKTG